MGAGPGGEAMVMQEREREEASVCVMRAAGAVERQPLSVEKTLGVSFFFYTLTATHAHTHTHPHHKLSL